VGEILHASLGPKLFTIGAFAESGGTIMNFSDWDNTVGYGRIWGVSSALKRELDAGCPEICFFDLTSVGAGSALARPLWVWVEMLPRRMALARDFDGIIWVRRAHAPQMPFSALLAWCTPRYWRCLAAVALALLLAAVFAVWIARTIAHRRRAARAFAGRFARRRRPGICKTDRI
jgi:hypothetical protein